MAKEILKPEVKVSGLLDMMVLGVVKSGLEQALTPVVGNGTVVSGGAKLIGGAVLQPKFGKTGNVLGSALLLDSVDDFTVTVLQMFGMGKTETGDDW